MPTDSNGVYSLPAGYLATTGTTIQISQHNPIFEDVQTALTARLPVNGSKGMTGALGLSDGLVGAPALRFTTALTTGLYKVTGGFGATVAGSLVASFTNGSFNFVDGGDIASATALTLGTGNVFNITGTTAITSIATKGVGTIVWLRFNAALTLTHDATNLILLSGASITTRAGDWAQFEEYGSGTWRMTAYHRADGTAITPSLPRGHISGCILSNGSDATNDINLTGGKCRDSTDTVDIVVSANTSGKQLDANWAVSGTTNSGMRNSAAGIANGTYHIYAARTAASSAATIYAYAGVAGTDPDSAAAISTMLTALQAESGGSSYVYARRIGSIVRVSAAIVAFVQDGDYTLWVTPKLDITQTNQAAAGSRTLTAIQVPLGVKVRAHIMADAVGSGTGQTGLVYFTSPDQGDVTTGQQIKSFMTSTTSVFYNEFNIRTDTSGRIGHRSGGSNVDYHVTTLGYFDIRGKDA